MRCILLNIKSKWCFEFDKHKIAIKFPIQKLSKYFSFFSEQIHEYVVCFQTMFNAAIKFPSLYRIHEDRSRLVGTIFLSELPLNLVFIK